ncbi:CRAL-TRIO domain-containing protein [Mucidula mucida]|nr:CRAL-TRIO domain-containing protein [Mucidula mucida]
MDIYSLLQANCDRLLEQYQTNVRDVRMLQETMLKDILPSVVDELSLGKEEVDWANPSIFHLLRRNNFTKSFALEAIRKNLIWRLGHVWPPDPTITAKMAESVRCLPSDITDPLGRPIIVIQFVPFDTDTVDYKAIVYRAFEQLRCHLNDVNHNGTERTDRPALQYVVLLDLKGLSMRAISFDLVSWVLTDVIPRFPGMLSAVFMLNFTWTHSTIWSTIKRLLPASALSRVFFPDRNELVNYFTPAALPQDYGGNLEPLLDLNDPLQSVPSVPVVHHPPRILPSPALSVPDILSTSIFLSPTSALNPFYGYPVAVLGTSASLHHGRRRKRDLARTLLRLLWLRWRGSITSCIWLCLLVFAARLTRRWVLQSRDGREVLRVFLSSASNW